MSVIGSLVIIIWLFLTASEHVSRSILVTRTAVSAVNSLMLSRYAHLGATSQPVPPGSAFAGSGSKHPSQRPSATDSGCRNIGKDCNKETDSKRKETCTAAERERVTGCSAYGAHPGIGTRDGSARTSGTTDFKEGQKSSSIDFETSVWINVIMSSLWGVEHDGGLGPYISQSIQEVVNEELALVPPGIANIQLKKFTLGTQTPIIQAVKVQSKRASICITPADQPTPRKSTVKKWRYAQEEDVDREEVELKKGEGLQGRTAFNSAVVTGEQKNMKVLAEEPTDKNIESSMGGNKKTSPITGLAEEGGSEEWSQWREWQSEWDKRHTKHPSSTTTSTSDFLQNSTQKSNSTGSSSSTSAGNVIRRPGGGSGCERLVVDIDLTYVSRNMDIILTLRSSDVRSVLPEATVTLSGVVLAGIIRLDAELTPDYPFFGNATVSACTYSHLLSYPCILPYLPNHISIFSPFYRMSLLCCFILFSPQFPLSFHS